MSEMATTPRSSRRESSLREERMEVLQMLESGTISAEDAARLLDALERGDRQGLPASGDLTEPVDQNARRVRIKVSDAAGTRVNLAVPLNLVDAGLGIAHRVAPNRLGDLGALRQAILSGITGPILEVHGEDGSTVSIVVE